MDSFGDVGIREMHSQSHNDLDHHLFDPNMNNISVNSTNSITGTEGSDFLSSFFPIDHQDDHPKTNSSNFDSMDVEFGEVDDRRDHSPTRPQDRKQSPRDTIHSGSSSENGTGSEDNMNHIHEGGVSDCKGNSESGGTDPNPGSNNSQNPSLAGTGVFGLGNLGSMSMPMFSPSQMSPTGNMEFLNGMTTTEGSPGISNMGSMGMGGVMTALQNLSANGGLGGTLSGSTPSPGTTGASIAEGQGQLSQQIMLEQFKLAQLQQLQQLQNQIFQQQMALINGGAGIVGTARSSTNNQSSSDTASSSLDVHQQEQQQRPNQYHSLPTPGSSAELRATSHPIPVDFVSPMILSYNDLDMPGSSSMSSSHPSSHPDRHHSHSQSHPHSVTHTPAFPPHNSGMGGIDLDGLAPLTPLSTHFGGSQSNAPAHAGHSNHHARSNDRYLAHRGTSSAPAHIAFGNPLNMGSEPCSPLPSDLDFDISPLTSPWLGAEMGMGGNGGRVQAYHHHHLQQGPHHHHTQSQGAGTKRTASPSGDISSNGGARKRQQSISQSPATRPIVSSNSNNVANKRPSRSGAPSSGSRSTNSTPLLRGTSSSSKGRRESGIGSMSSPMVSSPLGTTSHNTGMGISGVPGSDGFGAGIIGDSPSPVDLSMPPPANPASSTSVSSNQMGTTSVIGGSNSNAPLPHLMPVTPAIIMNLGLGSRNGLSQALSGRPSESDRFDGSGMNLPPPPPPPEPVAGSSNATSDANSVGIGKPAGKAKETGSTTTRRSGRKAAASATLKTLLPAGSATQSVPMSPLISSSTPSVPAPVVPLKERKTSHKAAEQKRRDSLKTTFDDLRGLLPPIPLPTDEKFTEDGSGVGFIAVAKASMLPGALPPRGPPKAGGEGPNKGVSKLQLLICGNEYIRVLRGRVERRDDELERLRSEVRRLRGKLDNAGLSEDLACEGEGEESLDLERDIDAVEIMNMSMGLSGGASSMTDVAEEDEEN